MFKLFKRPVNLVLGAKAPFTKLPGDPVWLESPSSWDVDWYEKTSEGLKGPGLSTNRLRFTSRLLGRIPYCSHAEVQDAQS